MEPLTPILGQTLATRTGPATGDLVWVFSDLNNTGGWQVRATDSTVTTRRTFPFGGQRGTLGAWKGDQGFVGGLIDADAGYTRVGARDYDTHTGRFTTPDPILDPSSPLEWNPYGYGGWNPTTNPDPTGLKWCPETCDPVPPSQRAEGVSQADWVNNYDATYGPGNPSATSQAVVGTRLDNPVRAATRANATYREQERAWGHSQRSPNTRPPTPLTPTQATVGAVATGLVVFGIGCALRVCGQGAVVATQLAVYSSCSNGGYCPPGWAQDTLFIAGMFIGGGKVRIKGASSSKSRGNVVRPVGRHLESMDDVMMNPKLLSGKSPAEVEALIGKTPGWQVEKLGKGSRRGEGWMMREYNGAGSPTGQQIRWHPGGGHHGPAPYWRVVGANGDIGGVIR